MNMKKNGRRRIYINNLNIFLLSIIFFMILDSNARHEMTAAQQQPVQQQQNSFQQNQSQQNNNQVSSNMYSNSSNNNSNYFSGSNGAMNQNNQNNNYNNQSNNYDSDDDSDNDYGSSDYSSNSSLNYNSNQSNNNQYNNNNNQLYNSGNYQDQSNQQDDSQDQSQNNSGQNIPSLNAATASCDPSDPSCAQATATCDPSDPSCASSQDNSGSGGGDSDGPSSFVTSIQNNPELAVLGALGAVGGVFMMIEPIKGMINWLRKRANNGERIQYEEAAELTNKKYKAKVDLIEDRILDVRMSKVLPADVKAALISNLKAQKSAYIEVNNAVQKSLKNSKGETTINAKKEGEKLDKIVQDIDARVVKMNNRMEKAYGYDVDVENDNMVKDNEVKYKTERQAELKQQRQQKELQQKDMSERRNNSENDRRPEARQEDRLPGQEFHSYE